MPQALIAFLNKGDDILHQCRLIVSHLKQLFPRALLLTSESTRVVSSSLRHRNIGVTLLILQILPYKRVYLEACFHILLVSPFASGSSSSCR